MAAVSAAAVALDFLHLVVVALAVLFLTAITISLGGCYRSGPLRPVRASRERAAQPIHIRISSSLQHWTTGPSFLSKVAPFIPLSHQTGKQFNSALGQTSAQYTSSMELPS